jgi:hypothetical protein
LGHSTAATTAHVGEAAHPVERPEPIAAPWSLAWIGQGLVKVSWSVVAAHVIRYAYVTAYFLATQNPWVRPGWNSLLDGLIGVTLWTILRHFLRAGLESEMTSATVWVMIANPFALYKPRKQPRPFMKFVRGLFVPEWLQSVLERLGMPTPRTYAPNTRLTWWQWVVALPALVIAAAPGYVLGIGIYFLARLGSHWLGIHPHFDYSSYPEWAQQDISVFTQQWHYTVAGILGTLFYARLVFKVYAAELMEILAGQMAGLCHQAKSKGRRRWAWLLAAHKLYPVGYRAAFLTAYRNPPRPRRVAAVMLLLAVTYLVLSVPFGYIVLTKVATHQWQIPGFH